MIENEKEIWKALPGVPGIEVSTFGNVRTMDRVISSEKYTRFQKGQVLKPCEAKGYLLVGIKINGKLFKRGVHRLVAQTFIPNPDNFPEVNHKDCNRKNNNVYNLEWCTRQENIAYRDKLGHTARNNAPKSPVFAVNLKTLEVLRFCSQREAGRELVINQCDVNAVIKGRQKTAHGFWFVNYDKNSDDAISRKLQEIKKTKLALYR